MRPCHAQGPRQGPGSFAVASTLGTAAHGLLRLVTAGAWRCIPTRLAGLSRQCTDHAGSARGWQSALGGARALTRSGTDSTTSCERASSGTRQKAARMASASAAPPTSLAAASSSACARKPSCAQYGCLSTGDAGHNAACSTGRQRSVLAGRPHAAPRAHLRSLDREQQPRNEAPAHGIMHSTDGRRVARREQPRHQQQAHKSAGQSRLLSYASNDGALLLHTGKRAAGTCLRHSREA